MASRKRARISASAADCCFQEGRDRLVLEIGGVDEVEVPVGHRVRRGGEGEEIVHRRSISKAPL